MRLSTLALAALLPATVLLAASTPTSASDADVHVVALTLKDHRFAPEAIQVPAGHRVRIDLTNEDMALEEFDSYDLHVEKDVTPKGKVSFTVGPLKPGTYSFMGELHADTASGTITAVAAP